MYGTESISKAFKIKSQTHKKIRNLKKSITNIPKIEFKINYGSEITTCFKNKESPKSQNLSDLLFYF